MTDAVIGEIGILLGVVGAAFGVGAIGLGLALHRRSLVQTGTIAPFAVLLGALVATGAMEHALITHDFALSFVAANNSKQTPLFFTVTGLWSALQGSMLLWGLILAGYIALVAVRFRRRREEPLVAIALLVSLVIAGYFFALMVGPANPFPLTAGPVPADGAGPNVLLQDNTLVAVHPIFLYLGFVGFTIPFAFAIASLITGRLNEGWLVATRRFAIFSWAFLTIGIVLGALWSYQVLGWGGFWGWDPVENAALLPWLTSTAYLHSVMIQERRGLLRVWNLSLLIATFALTILGTFLTRSGVVDSVHAFSDSGLGPALIGLFAVVVFVGVGLIGWRGDRLHGSASIDAPVSREAAFLLNNLLFAAFATVVLLGTVFPLFVQAINGQSITIGAPYFDAFSVPLGFALLFFMAIAPVLPWRKAAPGLVARRIAVPAWCAAAVLVACVAGGLRGLTPLAAYTLGAFAASSALRQLVLAAVATRRHGLGIWRGLVGRANGGMIVHVGVVIVAVGLASTGAFGQRAEVTLRRGVTVVFDRHRFELVGITTVRHSADVETEALVRVDGGGIYRPAFSLFNGQTEAVGTPSIDSSLVDDVYLSPYSLTTASPGKPASATLDIVIQPLVIWLWIGGGVAAAGAMLAALPGHRRRRPTDPISIAVPELLEPPREPVPAGR